MIIRVDKCITFGEKKSTTKSIQYQPKLFINNQMIPCVDNGDSLKYLGRYFDFGMTNTMHKSKLTVELNKILSQIDLLPFHPKHKILLYSRHLLSKISWHLLQLIFQKHGFQRTFTILSHLRFVDGWKFLSVEPK